MKKILSNIILVLVIFAITSSVYADEVKLENKLEFPQYTFEDKAKELYCDKYNLALDGVDTNKTLNIHHYPVAIDGNYVELRDLLKH